MTAEKQRNLPSGSAWRNRHNALPRIGIIVTSPLRFFEKCVQQTKTRVSQLPIAADDDAVAAETTLSSRVEKKEIAGVGNEAH